MEKAGREAGLKGVPVVLDPVGAGASRFRLDTCRRLLKACPVSLVRANASEAATLLGDMAVGRGVDSVSDPLPLEESLMAWARAEGLTVVASGAVDIVTDGAALVRIRNGRPMMTRVTAMGCAATALVGAFAAGETPPLLAAAAAMAVMGVCGEKAAQAAAGPGTFVPCFPRCLGDSDRRGPRIGFPWRIRERWLKASASWTDDDLDAKTLAGVVEEALRAGVRMIQYRKKTIPSREFYLRACEIKRLTDRVGAALIINDRMDVAMAVGAQGAHLGQKDLPATAARRIADPGFLIGLSVESQSDVANAEDAEVDYLGISPLFATNTKTELNEPFGLAGLKEAAGKSRHRLMAIGGIDESNVVSAARAGAHAVAVVTAISRAPSPYAAAKNLVAAFGSPLRQG